MINLGIFLLLVASCSAFQQLGIVNGTDALEGEFPYVVSLRNNLAHFCGGSILNERYVLTAAHCVCHENIPHNPENFTVQYGSVLISKTENRSIRIEEIACGNFDAIETTYDVAVVKLTDPIPNDGTWKPVRVAKEFNTTGENNGVIVGWGAIGPGGPYPNTLQKLEVITYNDTVCGMGFNNFHHICFGAPVGGACYGDSGTALFFRGEQVGIASFIVADCGITGPETPNVYSRVPSYFDWIKEHSKL